MTPELITDIVGYVTIMVVNVAMMFFVYKMYNNKKK